MHIHEESIIKGLPAKKVFPLESLSKYQRPKESQAFNLFTESAIDRMRQGGPKAQPINQPLVFSFASLTKSVRVRRLHIVVPKYISLF